MPPHARVNVIAILELTMRFQLCLLAGIFTLTLLPDTIAQTSTSSRPGLTARELRKQDHQVCTASPYSKALQNETGRSLFASAWPIDRAKDELRRERCGSKTVRCALRRAFSKTWQDEIAPNLFESAWPTGKANDPNRDKRADEKNYPCAACCDVTDLGRRSANQSPAQAFKKDA